MGPTCGPWSIGFDPLTGSNLNSACGWVYLQSQGIKFEIKKIAFATTKERLMVRKEKKILHYINTLIK